MKSLKALGTRHDVMRRSQKASIIRIFVLHITHENVVDAIPSFEMTASQSHQIVGYVRCRNFNILFRNISDALVFDTKTFCVS